jgi:uncharacterized membrane protein
MLILSALLIGIIAGLRAMTAPAAVSWAAHLGWLSLGGTWLAFMGSIWALGIFTILAVVEFVTDHLPTTPSRTVPPQFGARIVMGALCGGAIGATGGGVEPLAIGLVAGIVGAVIGTLGGARARAHLAATFGRDLPAALIEDAVAILGGLAIVRGLL